MANTDGNNTSRNKGFEATAQLLKNRIGLQPKGAMFELNNVQVEDAILNYFGRNGIKTDDDVYVRAIWNHEYDSVMYRGKDTGAVPFKVLVIAKIKNNPKNKKMQGSGLLARIARNLASSASSQVELIGRDDLNRVVKALSVVNDHGDVNWHFASRNAMKKGIVSTELDFSKVMQLIFSVDEMNRRVLFDFLSVSTGKNNRSFVTRVLIQYVNDKIHNKKKIDPLDLIGR